MTRVRHCPARGVQYARGPVCIFLPWSDGSHPGMPDRAPVGRRHRLDRGIPLQRRSHGLWVRCSLQVTSTGAS